MTDKPLFDVRNLRTWFEIKGGLFRKPRGHVRTTNMSPNRWTQRPDPDGLLYVLFHSKGFANTTGYKNDRVDALLEEARKTYDQPARKKLYDEIQEILVKDIPMFSLPYSVEYAVPRDSVQGFAWIPDRIPRFRDLRKK
ncbi:MAG: hypothetical protein ACREC6_07270 [Hyphomicrobiaceae bacterium]